MSSGNSTLSEANATAISESTSNAQCSADSRFQQTLTIDKFVDNGCPGSTITVGNTSQAATTCSAPAQACSYAKAAQSNEQLAHAFGVLDSDTNVSSIYQRTATTVNSGCTTEADMKQMLYMRDVEFQGELCRNQVVSLTNTLDSCTGCVTGALASMSSQLDNGNKADDSGNLMMLGICVVGGLIVLKTIL